jgi:hypothetical protein
VIKTVAIPERCLKEEPPDQRRVQFNKVTPAELKEEGLEPMDEHESVYYVTRLSLEHYIYNRDSIRDWAEDAWTRCGDKPEEEDE